MQGGIAAAWRRDLGTEGTADERATAVAQKMERYESKLDRSVTLETREGAKNTQPAWRRATQAALEASCTRARRA